MPEDSAFTLDCYLKARNICVITDQCYYRYNRRGPDQSLAQRKMNDMDRWWQQYLLAVQGIEAAAVRHVNMEEHPAICVRMCQNLHRMLNVVLDGKVSDDRLSDVSAILSGHYTQAVRAGLSRERLIVFDALDAGLSADELRAVREAQRANRVQVLAERYTLYAEDGEILFQSERPETAQSGN